MDASATANGQALCPPRLNTILASPPCRAHMQRLLSTSYTTIVASSSDSANDSCVDSLGAPWSSTPPGPCAMYLDPFVSHRSHIRQLATARRSLFKGKLNCTFDLAAPLNVSDLSQGFELNCEQIKGPSDYTWLWRLLGIAGIAVVLWVGYAISVAMTPTIQRFIATRRERRNQPSADRLGTPSTDLPYAQA